MADDNVDTSKLILPTVDLEEVEVRTHEEEEEVVLQLRCKLYVFIAEDVYGGETRTNYWKERGLGDAKILKHKESGVNRLLMRQEKTHKICANHRIHPQTTMNENVGSDKSWVFNTFDFADNELVETTFAIRFKTPEVAQEFKAAYEKAAAENGGESTAAEKPAAEAAPEVDGGSKAHFYPIGVPGQAWGDEERATWRAAQSVKRSYAEEVLAKLEPLKEKFDVEQYGALSYDPERYPLFSVKTRNWSADKPTVLLTGGVHGYETSGVQGVLLFLATQAEAYSEQFNLVACPCVSPWGYECIQRWNANAVDPNRSFYADTPCEEAAGVMRVIAGLGDVKFTAHVDCHETTDTDESEFRPAKAARDGEEYVEDTIPDGFYLIGFENEAGALFEWHKAMIDSVRKVTHIAPPNDAGLIVGYPPSQEGVILSPLNSAPAVSKNLCRGVTNAEYAATTEVYPDSPNVTDEECNKAQVACITGGLDFIVGTQE